MLTDTNTNGSMLLAIDPGESSGVAIKVAGEYATRTVTEPHVLWEFFNNRYEAVIYEQFAAQLISSHGLHTVRLVGGIEALVYKLHMIGYPQPPQKRRAFLSEARAILLEKYRTTHVMFTDHEQDALAHMLSWEYAATHLEKNAHGVIVPMRASTKGTRTK